MKELLTDAERSVTNLKWFEVANHKDSLGFKDGKYTLFIQKKEITPPILEGLDSLGKLVAFGYSLRPIIRWDLVVYKDGEIVYSNCCENRIEGIIMAEKYYHEHETI